MKHTLKILLIFLLTWVSSISVEAQTPIPVCPQSASFTGAVRGYYFTAPTTFTICGIYVEDDMSTAFQAAAVVRFTAGPPPAFAGTTNNFVTLWQNLNYVPNNMIPVPNITINAGDIIGVYGARTANSVNSYGPANCVINIQGFPTTTFRSGMQFDLAAGPGMHDIWNENNGSIGRVTMYTNCCPVPTPIAAITGPITVCEGDAVTYSVPAQAGATAYNWTVPAGATITGGQNTTSLNVTWNTAPGGNVCVDWTDPCATSTPTCLAVTVNPPTTPTFTPVTAICSGGTLPALPTTSTNGVTGTWSPAINNTTTTLYTFTPTAGSCATTTTMTITVNPNITPIFTPVATICSGNILVPLPTTSTNGITGTWSPAINNTATTLYTFTPTAGLCATTITMTITVNPIPPAPTALAVTICPNNTATLNATAPGGTYEWYDAAVAGNLLFTGSSYTTPVLVANGTYWVQTTINGCTSPRTMVTVTIAAAISVNAGADTAICAGQSSPLSVTPNGAGFSYLWDEPANLGFSTIFNPSVTPAATTTYTVTVTDPSGCIGTDMITITVNPVPTVTVPTNATYCDGDPVPVGTFTSAPAGGTFSWTNSDPTIGLAASGTGNTPAFTATNATGSPITATISVTPTLTGCLGTPVNYTITINPIPTVTVPANATYCDGDPVPAGTFTSAPAGGTFSWTNSDPTIGLAASGTGNTPAFTAANATGSPITATIVVTPTANSCVGIPVNYTITINPLPTVTVPVNATYCNGDPVPPGAFTSSPSGGTFTWTNSDPTIGLAASGTGNTPAFNAVNATNAPITTTIIVTPTANGCTGLPVNYTITVNPGAVANVPANMVVCNGAIVSISSYTSTPAGGTFTWTNSDPTIGLAASGTGNTPAFTATNATGSPIIATISVIATAGGCPGVASTYTITINPIITSSANVVICQGDSILINGGFVQTAGTYIETLTTSLGCDSIITYNLTVNNISTATVPIVICQGDSILIEDNYYSTTTSFPFTYTNSLGCDSIVTYNITVAPLPSFTITDDGTFINLGQSVTLAVIPGVVGTTYSWSPPDGLSCLFCQNPIATPEESMWYYVTVTNANGCSITDSVFIDVDPSSNIYVPNIFSPNGDGNNDVYFIRGKGIKQFNLSIYNRWGQLVFESESIERGWDGTKNGKTLNQGVFVYKLHVVLHTGKTIEQTGNVTLVR